RIFSTTAAATASRGPVSLLRGRPVVGKQVDLQREPALGERVQAIFQVAGVYDQHRQLIMWFMVRPRHTDLLDNSTNRLALCHTHDIATGVQIENKDWKPIVATHCDR